MNSVLYCTVQYARPVLRPADSPKSSNNIANRIQSIDSVRNTAPFDKKSGPFPALMPSFCSSFCTRLLGLFLPPPLLLLQLRLLHGQCTQGRTPSKRQGDEETGGQKADGRRRKHGHRERPRMHNDLEGSHELRICNGGARSGKTRMSSKKRIER